MEAGIADMSITFTLSLSHIIHMFLVPWHWKIYAVPDVPFHHHHSTRIVSVPTTAQATVLVTQSKETPQLKW